MGFWFGPCCIGRLADGGVYSWAVSVVGVFEQNMESGQVSAAQSVQYDDGR